MRVASVALLTLTLSGAAPAIARSPQTNLVTQRTRFPLVAMSSALRGLAAAAAPSHVATLSLPDAPVCALADPDQDAYFVSSINGEGTIKDNNGYISRVAPDGRMIAQRFIEGGRAGAVLNAPKGLAILGDELWVADIDVVRSFDRHTGRPLRTVTMPAPGALFLNEMATGPDGAAYVTDTRLDFRGQDARHVGPDRIFRITRAGTTTVALEDRLEAPSGIAWDPTMRRFLITALQGTHIYAWRPGEASATAVWQGVGGYDGIVVDGSRWLVSSFNGTGVYAIGDGREERIIEHLTTPAAIAFDFGRRQLLIPSFGANTLQIWHVPGS